METGKQKSESLEHFQEKKLAVSRVTVGGLVEPEQDTVRLCLIFEHLNSSYIIFAYGASMR